MAKADLLDEWQEQAYRAFLGASRALHTRQQTLRGADDRHIPPDCRTA